MRRSRVKVDTARTIIAILAALYLPSLIPIFSPPFGGCGASGLASGFATLQGGCSDWPEFFRGFLFMSLAAVAPYRLRLPIVALLVLFAVAALGGVGNITTGLTGSGSLIDWVMSFVAGLPILLGGLVAYLLHILVLRQIAGHGVAA